MPAFQYEGEGGRGLVLSALAQPQQSFDGRFLYRTIFEKGAALLYSIVMNHGFTNGNKRIGWATLSLFFVFNNYVVYAPQAQTVRLTLQIAQNQISRAEIALWLRRRALSRKQLDAILMGRREDSIQLAQAALQHLRALVGVMTRVMQARVQRGTASS